MKFLLLFGVFLAGMAYIGYANAILTERVSAFDRALILGLAIAGNYFVAKKIIEVSPALLKWVRSLFGSRGPR